jgi:hypothetical protein
LFFVVNISLANRSKNPESYRRERSAGHRLNAISLVDGNLISAAAFPMAAASSGDSTSPSETALLATL